MKEIIFQGLGRSASAHNAENGEMAALTGAIPENGALVALRSLQWQYRMPQGCKAIGIHHTPAGDNCIIIKNTGGQSAQVCRMPMDADSPQPDVTAIAQIKLPCSGMAAVGHTVSLATGAGLMHMAWTGNGYAWLGAGPEMPVIEFGIEKAGSLELATSYRVPATLAPLKHSGSGTPGSGAWLPHPEGHQAWQDCTSAIKTITADIHSAIERQIESQGMWHQPFLVRYALRLADGSATLPSPPVLMLPTVLPPCIAVGSVAATDDEGVNIVNFDASTCLYFKLVCRVAKGLDPKWAPMVMGVDIYATPQIPAYLASASACSGIVEYAALVGCANTASATDRGRRSRAESPADAFLGHYSEAGSNFRDYTVGDRGLSNVRAWDFAPDPALRHNLAAAKDYHLIATIPVADLQTQSVFAAVDVSTTKASAIAAAPKLQCGWLSHFRYAPQVVHSFNRRLLCGGGGKFAPSPIDLRCAAAASGTAGSESGEATEVAILSAHGTAVCSKASWLHAPVFDADSFPRYLHVPDSNAYALLLRQGARCWRLPLRPHHGIGGAYWMGSLAECREEAFRIDSALFDSDTAGTSDLIAEPSAVYSSRPYNPLVISGKTEAGDGRLIAIQAALQPMSQGQFGQFPLYAFATDGIWALTATDSGYATRQPVTRDVCVSATAIAATDRGVAFISQRGVMLINGAKCECLSTGLLAPMACKLAALPQIDTLCRPATLPSLSAILASGPMLSYDSANARLWVYADDGGMAMVCAFPGYMWGSATDTIAAPVQGAWVQDRNGRLASLSRQGATTGKVTLITRPIKMRQPVCAAPMSALRITGRAHPSSVKMIVYGSNDLEHWHIAATSQTSECRNIAGTPYRYHIVAATASLSHCEDLCGVIASPN